MAKRGRGYLGLGVLVSVILAFFLGWIFTWLERFLRGNIIGGILCIFFFWVFMWIDIITLIISKDVTVLA